MKLKVCSRPGCPTLIPRGASACANHTKTTTEQGRGAAHQATRRLWAAAIAEAATANTTINCARCEKPITDSNWHLDHNDTRDGYLGPSHAWCNASAGGKASHRL